MAPLVLPPDLLAAWQDTVIHLGRPPRGTVKSELTPDQLLYKIMRAELKGIHELWETFTQERDQLTKHLLGSKQQMVRYLCGFHLPNAARMQLALNRLSDRFPIARLLASGRPIRWNDIGCGSGAAAQAGLHFALKAGMKLANLEMHLTDSSGVLLDTAKEVLSRAGADVDIVTHRMPLEKLKTEALSHKGNKEIISIYSLGYVWNELERNPQGQAKLKDIFSKHVKNDEAALLIFLEPANQVFTRRLMMLRDEFVEEGYLPLYPCPKAGPCPMLERVRDWCYSEGEWKRPLFVQRLDHELGVDRSQLNVSIYVFATPALVAMTKLTPEAKKDEDRLVVVGRPEKGPAAGRKPVYLLKGVEPIFDYLLCNGAALSKAPSGQPAPAPLPAKSAEPGKNAKKLPPAAGAAAKPAAGGKGKKPLGKSFRLRGETYS